MYASLGNFTVYIAFIGLVAATFAFWAGARGVRGALRVARLSFGVATGALIVGCIALMTAILAHDFSIEYVAQYSSSDLPLIYLISAFWAGQMGTFLLWAALLGVCGVLIMRGKEKLDSGAMTIISLVTLAMVVIFLKKSPFDTLPMTPQEGQGLNPLLQDFWMAIHPPIMFIGFATAAVPFAFAIAGLYLDKADKWEARARSWTLVSWLTIGLSLMLGGYWAYKVLGWGGYWAWDPVENSSLIPWLFLTAQLHVLVIRRSRTGLSKFSPLLVSLTFISVLYGTFLTRSGVLQDFSVHSFVDLGLNSFLIVSLVFFTLLTAFAFQMRWSAIKSVSAFTSVNSMAYILTVGVIVLFLGALLTLGGTSAPLLTAFTENPSSVEMSYYTTTMTPIAFLTLITLALFPYFRWQHGVADSPFLYIGIGSFVAATLITKFGFSVDSWWWSLMIGAGVWALLSNGYQLRRVVTFGSIPAAPIIHIGLALLLVGATASSGLEVKDKVALQQGKPVQTMGHTLVFEGFTPLGTDTAFNVIVTPVDNEEGAFKAEMFHVNKSEEMGVVKTPHIQKSLLVDLYFSPLGTEIARGPGPVVEELTPGQSTWIGPYMVTFVGTEAVRDDPAKPARKLLCVVDVIREGHDPERLLPSLEMSASGFAVNPATLADGSGRISLDMDHASSTNGMRFTFDGSFAPLAGQQASVLVVEFSKKPLISLVWIGTLLLFGGGALALWAMKRQPQGFAGRDTAKENASPRLENEVNREESNAEATA
ncbi:MAG TPA: cytochrome c biogenesis protein CcsA [candidate division Zixibacteria bacterium]|nr:cytochrome c biogenesis protein CcsA [candidate division Zixibacteria bacterium]